LMLFTLTLSTGMTSIAAADQPANQTVLADQSSTGNHTENTDKNIAQTNEEKLAAGEPTSAGTAASTTSTKAAGGSSAKAAAGSSTKAAGGSSAVVKTTASAGSTWTVTDSQIKDAAGRVKSFIEKNDRLPNYVTIGSKQVSMSQYLKLVNQETLNLYGSSGSLTVGSVSGPTNPAESVKSGNIQKSEYLKLAKNILNFMSSNGRAPNYASSSLGTIRYESLVYAFSRVVAFHDDNSRLPNYVSVKSWTSQTGGTNPGDTTTDPALQKYLVATANAQSTSSTIKNLAASITSGKTTTYAKAQAIFNWVRDHVSYSFYYNTQKGALGAYSSRSANCCDMAHLVVALARAAGIPARYQHGTCTFSSGTYGHVWAQLYVSGKWYYADAVSTRNSFGTINNWNLNTYTLHGTYASLPF